MYTKVPYRIVTNRYCSEVCKSSTEMPLELDLYTSYTECTTKPKLVFSEHKLETQKCKSQGCEERQILKKGMTYQTDEFSCVSNAAEEISVYVDLVYLALYEGFSQEINLTHMQESAKEKGKDSKLLAFFFLRTFELFSAVMGLPTVEMKMYYSTSSLPTQAKKIRKSIAKKSPCSLSNFLFKETEGTGNNHCWWKEPNQATVKRRSGTLKIITFILDNEPPWIFSMWRTPFEFGYLWRYFAFSTQHFIWDRSNSICIKVHHIWLVNTSRTGQISIPRLKAVASSLHLKFPVSATVLFWKPSDLKLLEFHFFDQSIHWHDKYLPVLLCHVANQPTYPPIM